MILAEPKPIVSRDATTEMFFNSYSVENYQEYITKTTDYISNFLSRKTFYSGDKNRSLYSNSSILNLKDQKPIELDDLLSQLKEVYLDHTIAFHNPNYVAHLNCPVLLPAVIGDLIASSVNTAVETWDQSISATFIEQQVIAWINNEMRLGEGADGVFTSGGTHSNFMALMIARDDYAFKHFGINIKENGWSDVVSRFRIFCSEKAHFSIQKNAAMLGMGYDAVISVSTDDTMKMIPEALVLAIEKEKQKGNIPIAVVATAGTTDFGSFDPLNTIAKIAKEQEMWFHVDGAYGGCFVLTETHKSVLRGVEYADSVTIDFHKSLFQPVCCSAFLLRDKKNFKYVSYYADYLNPFEHRNDDCPNLIEKSTQTTRRFDALKVWISLKMVGAENLGQLLEKVHYLALDLYHSLKNDPDFEVIHKPELSTLVFRYTSAISNEDLLNTLNLHIKNSIFKSGKASIASTKIDKRVYLKFTLLNPMTTIEDLLSIIEMIKVSGEQFLKQN